MGRSTAGDGFVSTKMKVSSLNGITLVVVAALWGSGLLCLGDEIWDQTKSTLARKVHIGIGAIFPIFLLVVVAERFRRCPRGIALRLSYAMLAVTSLVGALTWGVRLPHIERLHFWLAVISLVPVVIWSIQTLRQKLRDNS